MHILEISGLVRIQPVKGVGIRYFISISLKRAVRCRGADLMTSFNDYCGLIINQFAHVRSLL